MAQKHIVQLIDDLDGVEAPRRSNSHSTARATKSICRRECGGAARRSGAVCRECAPVSHAGSRVVGARRRRSAPTANRPRRFATGPAKRPPGRRQGPHSVRSLEAYNSRTETARQLVSRRCAAKKSSMRFHASAADPARGRHWRCQQRPQCTRPVGASLRKECPRSGTPSRRARLVLGQCASSFAAAPRGEPSFLPLAGHDRAGAGQRLSVWRGRTRSCAARRNRVGVTRAKAPPMQKPMIPTVPCSRPRSAHWRPPRCRRGPAAAGEQARMVRTTHRRAPVAVQVGSSARYPAAARRSACRRITSSSPRFVHHHDAWPRPASRRMREIGRKLR